MRIDFALKVESTPVYNHLSLVTDEQAQPEVLRCDDDEQLAKITSSEQQGSVDYARLGGLACLVFARLPEMGFFYNELPTLTAGETSSIDMANV